LKHSKTNAQHLARTLQACSAEMLEFDLQPT
jgi:hypothetical protein